MMFLKYDSKSGTYKIMLEMPMEHLTDKQKMLAKKAHDMWVLFTDKKPKVHIYQERL